jgi:hypothetical protein
MAQTTYTLTEADIGAILPVPNGYLVSLIKTQVGIREEPEFSAALQQWKRGYFVLRASLDHRNLIAIGPFDTIPTMTWAQGGSYGYAGELKVICVPKGSTWQVVLSDAPVTRPPAIPTARITAAIRIGDIRGGRPSRVKPSEVFRCPSRACR